MTKLVLYAARPESVPVIRCSPPSFAALIALLEEGVDHELRWIRFDAGEHKTPEMLRLSPAGTVPILVDGDDVVTDTVEILERIARHSGHLTDPSAMDDARALKDAGMRALVSRGASRRGERARSGLRHHVCIPWLRARALARHR
jgi:glutathione S-transferase